MNNPILFLLLIGLFLTFFNILDTNIVAGQINLENDTTSKDQLMNVNKSSIFNDLTTNALDNMNMSNGVTSTSQNTKVVEIIGNNFSFPIAYEEINGLKIAEGDIVIDTSIRDPFEAAGDRFIYSDIWPNGEIPYKIDLSLSAEKINMIKRAINYWNENTLIRFIEITPSNEDRFENYVHIIREDDGLPGASCSSNIGKLAKGGEQNIWIYPGCKYGNMIHELGHTVGLWHEQSRPDRDHYIQIIWNNIIPQDRVKLQFAIERCFNADGEQVCDFPDELGNYDYCSVEHYGRNAFAIQQGLETIRPLSGIIGCSDIGQRQFLSPGDIAGISELYKSELQPVTERPPTEVPTVIPEFQFLQYDDDYFKIKYPAGSIINGPFTSFGHTVYLTPPESIPMIDGIGIDVNDVPTQTTIEDYVSKEKISHEEILGEELTNTIEKRITINNIPAIELSHNHLFQGAQSVWTTIYILDDSKIYEISYEVHEHNLPEIKGILDYMINSFEINR